MAASPPAFLEDTFAGGIRLAVFGKHPAAADHLEDIGLSTASLVAFKQGFYIDGIGGSLAKQTWHKDLAASDSVPYDHELLCVGGAGWIAARFTHSTDATGRRQYPFVVAAHGRDLSALAQATSIHEVLDDWSSAMAGLKDSAALRQAHAQAQVEWETKMVQWVAESQAIVPAKEAWVHAENLGPDLVGLQRIAHALLPLGAGAGRARVPLAGYDPGLSQSLWLSLAEVLLQGQVSVLTILARHGEGFGDLVLGPPGARSLTTLFAGLDSQPLTSSVPYSLGGELTTLVAGAVSAWVQEPGLFPEPEFAEDGSNSLIQRICSGFRSWLKS